MDKNGMYIDEFIASSEKDGRWLKNAGQAALVRSWLVAYSSFLDGIDRNLISEEA